ncbi:SRPBCC family protein [Aestuariivirga sp.]|uniref:SRPBCC family protein n=1 Tax=Aestuariivirga sp. TaxID=2650926 RepID=UPI003594782F
MAKSIIKGIVLILIVAVVTLVGGAYLLPPEARVSRAKVINASPEQIFAIAGNLRRFNEWSPWASLDPETVYRFEGPDQGGVGQKMSWASNDPNVGKGTQTITELVPNQKIVTDVDFGEMGQSLSTMTLQPADGGTLVTWDFQAKLDGVMNRWMGLMFDRLIGGDYEKGLSNLESVVEKEAAGD